jgi:hypothetical protein
MKYLIFLVLKSIVGLVLVFCAFKIRRHMINRLIEKKRTENDIRISSQIFSLNVLAWTIILMLIFSSLISIVEIINLI